MQEIECLALGRTDWQHLSAMQVMRKAAYDRWFTILKEAGNVQTDESRKARADWNAINRILVEIFKLANKDYRVEVVEFVAAEWMHECARTTKRDGIPVFDGKFWWCSRCKSGHGVDTRGTTLDVAIEMFWKYLANGSWKRRVQ